jgi:hypothetical protein
LQGNDPEQTQRAKALGLLLQNVAAFAFGFRKVPCRYRAAAGSNLKRNACAAGFFACGWVSLASGMLLI